MSSRSRDDPVRPSVRQDGRMSEKVHRVPSASARPHVGVLDEDKLVDQTVIVHLHIVAKGAGVRRNVISTSGHTVR